MRRVTLRHQLEDPLSPVRLMLEDHLPDLTAAMRATWRPAMAGRALHAPPEGELADVLGIAIGERLAWTRAPLAGPDTPLLGADPLLQIGAAPALISELHDVAGTPATENTPHAAGAAALIGMMDRVWRYPMALVEPIYEEVFTAAGLDEAIARLPQPWIPDITTITAHNSPLLAHLTGPATPGVTFSGSGAVGGADADLIAGTTLVEIKAVRTRALTLRTLRQLIVYALLDFDDQYALTHAALLSARYAQLVTWDLRELLDQAGGTTLPKARDRLQRVLR